MAKTGFYTGSFDPVTLGHLDVISRAARMVDELVLGIGVHDAKKPMFSAEERYAMLERETQPIVEASGAHIRIVTFNNLAVDAARTVGATIIVRGVRNTTDLNYEAQMAAMNREMAPDLDTVFLVSSPGVSHIAANLVRQIAAMGGDPSAFVSPAVAADLKSKASSA